MQPRVLLDGLAMPESPRWHDGRLWFSNWGTRQIIAVDLDGSSKVVGEGPDGLGWATNWLVGCENSDSRSRIRLFTGRTEFSHPQLPLASATVVGL
jgi:sugar lactone lactonase YvrE